MINIDITDEEQLLLEKVLEWPGKQNWMDFVRYINNYRGEKKDQTEISDELDKLHQKIQDAV